MEEGSIGSGRVEKVIGHEKRASLFTKTYHRFEDMTISLGRGLSTGSTATSSSSGRYLMIRRRCGYFVRLSGIISGCRR